MSEKKKSYNVLSYDGVDDMEYVEELGLNPDLAYTPEINEAIIKAIEANNYTDYIVQGYSEEEASEMAIELANRGRANVAASIKAKKKAGL